MTRSKPRRTRASPPQAGLAATAPILGTTLGTTVALTLSLAVAGCMTAPGRPVPPAPSAQAAAQRCADLAFPIYFDRDSAHLTSAARVVLSHVVEQARSCSVVSTEVTGLTPADPTPADLTLSRDRAVEVAQALTQAGLPAPSPEVVETRPARSRIKIARQSARVLIHLKP